MNDTPFGWKQWHYAYCKDCRLPF